MTRYKHPSARGVFFLCHWERAVSKTEIFKLFGSILIDNDRANQAIDNTENRARGTTKTFGEMIGSAAKVGAGIAMAMGSAAIAVGGLAVSLTDDLQKSLNGVQASTGATDEAMVGMKDTMLAIYNDNFGENFEDIGAAISEVGKQTGLSGDALEGMTENALALRDTFEFEVNESTRSAKMLMDQFGMSGDEAFNLIAQGAQQGLDKNGDLLDSINEYSVHFQQLGLGADEMFNMLKNGAASGAFSIDKLGDAVKEFGIRSKDGSKTSADGFKALGLDAANMTKAFAAGGDTAKTALDKTAQALFALKDPVAQNAAGVALFGTQWEDLGVKGVEALVKTQGEISKSVDALAKINEVKYNTFGEATEGIKRNLETGILLPLGEKIMPKMNEFAGWITIHMPEIKETIEDAMERASEVIIFVKDNGETLIKVVGFLGAAWVVHKGYVIASTIATDAMTIALGIQKIAIGGSTAATWLFNAALTANPIGLTVLAIVGLIGILITVTGKWDAVTGAIKEAWDWLNKWNDEPAEEKTITTHYKNVSSATTMDERLGNNAEGTDFWRGGLTWVGEKGPEIVNLPRGSQVIPNNKIGESIGNSIGTLLHVEKLVIANDIDIQQLNNKLGFFWQQTAAAKGGG